METPKLENIDAENVEDLLEVLEKSFNIKFVGNELAGINDLGEFCDHISNKLQLENSNDCTSQQAFYKLRNSISGKLDIDKNEITRQRKLQEIFPKKERKSNIKKVEKALGFKMNILTSPAWIMFSLIAIFLLSFICFFFNWKIAVSGLAFSLVGFRLADLMANDLELENVEELVKKVVRNNYLQSRRDHGTFNNKEIEKVLMDLFCIELGFEKNELTRDTKFL